MTSTVADAPPRTARPGLVFVWTASAAVLAAALLTSFRQPLADDAATLLAANGARVVFAAAVGGLLALAGALRLSAGRVRAWEELERLALSTGAAGGGYAASLGRSGTTAAILFTIGALVGGALLWSLARALDRPKRWTNLAAAALLAALFGLAAFPGIYAGARTDFVAHVVPWLLGDLNRASPRSAAVLLGALAAIAVGAARTSPSAWSTWAWIAAGLALGAAGPLAFVLLMVPLAVRALTGASSPRVLWLASAAAGAATVAAVDAVPRLLVGGYDFPWNVPASMLALPGFLTWNRARLRREAGRASLVFEIAEGALIVGLTAGATALAVFLTRTVRLLT